MRTPSRIRKVEIVSQREAGPADSHAFLRLHRLKVRNTYVNGEMSPIYSYDGVLRKWLDAVVIVLTGTLDGHDVVCLRSCIRPPVLLRGKTSLPVEDEAVFCTMWELPAGLLEEGDRGASGIRKRASIEVMEETGYSVDSVHFTPLGGAPFTSPGVIPERLHFVTARVDDIADRGKAAGDGSPAEDGGGIWWIPVRDAMEMCESGEIVDAKTELGIRRWAALPAR